LTTEVTNEEKHRLRL